MLRDSDGGDDREETDGANSWMSVGVHCCEAPHDGHAVVGESKAILGIYRERHFWQGWGLVCIPAWAPGDLPVLEPAWEMSKGITGLPREAEPGRPMMGGQWLVPSTAQAAGEQSAHYKYIVG